MRRALLLSACAAACAPAPPSDPPRPRQILEGFTLTRSRAGEKAWRLEASVARLDEAARTAELDGPRMVFFREGKASTEVEALRGEVALETKEIRLSSAVTARFREDDSLLRTEALRYSEERRKIFSEAPVTVTRPGVVVHGEGFEAEPDLSRLRIIKQKTMVKEGKF